MDNLAPERARQLIAARWPSVRPFRVDRVAEGGDFDTFLVDDALIFRFARDAATAATLEREVALLRYLAPALPVAIPAYRYVAWADASYAFPFAGYPKLSGVSGEQVRPGHAHWPAVAAQMGQALTALHTFPEHVARERGAFTAPPLDTRALAWRAAAYREVLQERIPTVLTAEMCAYLDGRAALPASAPYAPLLCHADFKGEHILLTEDGTQLAGILDWSDARLTDTALDFAGLAIWLGAEFVGQVLAHYTAPHTEQLFERAIGIARYSTLEQVGMALTGASNAPLPLVLTQLHWAFV